MTKTELEQQIELHPESAVWMRTALSYHGTTEGVAGEYSRNIMGFFTSTMQASTSISVGEATRLSGNNDIGGVAASLTGRRTTISDGRGSANAWCSAFVNHVMIRSIGSGTHDVAAHSWIRWGFSRSNQNIPFGAILIFTRTGAGTTAGSGHVGFYVGEERGRYLVYGGNQSRDILTSTTGSQGIVGVTRHTKEGLLSVRWPYNSLSHPEQEPTHTQHHRQHTHTHSRHRH